mmetsp:Transcript_35100/g.111559  ORF Transcript_35100/g.111559 Transcript_35100/m.111559 type:complete len:203 (+) Transcript_35100:200-808(+)
MGLASLLHALQAPDDPPHLPVEVVDLLLGLAAEAEDVELDLEQMLRLRRPVHAEAAVHEVPDAHNPFGMDLQVQEEVLHLVAHEAELVEAQHDLWPREALLELVARKRALRIRVHGLEDLPQLAHRLEVLDLGLLQVLVRVGGRAGEHPLHDHAGDDVQQHEVREADEGHEEEAGALPAGVPEDPSHNQLPILKSHELEKGQ